MLKLEFRRRALCVAVNAAVVASLLGAAVPVAAAPLSGTDEPAPVIATRLAAAGPTLVFEREELLRSGAHSVADFLRGLPLNSFGSFRPQSLSSAQSFSELKLHGLPSQHTLILIDGRRAPVAPSVGRGQDLNVLPLAAIERIEVHPGGSSATHGSNAAGGVVNIITRKKFSGVELGMGASNPVREGGETEEGSVLFGSANDRGSMVVGAAYANRGIVYQRDRRVAFRLGTSTFSNNLLTAFPSPGEPNGFAPGVLERNPNFGSVVPGGCAAPGFSISGTGAAARCLYDFLAVASDEPELRTSALFARASYEINDDWGAYLNASVNRIESLGRAAPGLLPVSGQNLFIPVGSPNHPALRFPGAAYDATRPYFLRHRFAAVGTRDTTSDARNYDLEAGFGGRAGSFDIGFGARFVESSLLELGRNAILAANAQQAVANGSYNIYDPFGNPRSVLDAFTVTTNRDARYRAEELYASAAADTFDLGAGPARIGFGAEFRSESLSDLYDTLSSSGQIAGGGAADSIKAARRVAALHVDLNVPVTERVHVGLAVRQDEYSSADAESSGAFNLGFRPLESLLLRASFSTGFAAPGLDAIGLATRRSTDIIGCNLNPGFAGVCQYQFPADSIGNPTLRSESSRHARIGFEWAATPWLEVSADYYDIEIEDRIQAVGSRVIVDCLLGLRSDCPAGLVTLPAGTTQPIPRLGLGAAFGPTGAPTYVQRGFGNLGTIAVSGADLGISTRFDFADLGRLSNRLLLSWVRSFEIDGIEAVDQPSRPRQRAMLANSWDLGDFSFTWNINYIHGTQSTAATLDDGDYPARLGSLTTHDLQASWHAPWNAQLTLGIDNAGDQDPIVDPNDPTGRGYDFALYDGYGRTPYFRYAQAF